MRVSRTRAEENRQAVINVASRLFRKHGFDGIGLRDVMAGARLTQGAFYKQFSSKDELATLASQRALDGALRQWSTVADANPKAPLSAVVAFYLSMTHCAQRIDGCPIIALGSDAARQGEDVRASFEDGICKFLALISDWIGESSSPKKSRKEPDDKALSIFATMVGAVFLSRIVTDKQLSQRFLRSATRSVLTISATDNAS